MKKILLIIISVFSLCTLSRSQAVHYLHCLEVNGNGSVLLNWDGAAAGSEMDFDKYMIYHTDLSNPNDFQVAGQVFNYYTNSFIHYVTTANQQPNLYYIATVQNTGDTIFSDTLRSIHLTLNLNSADPIIVALNWNAEHIPLLPSSSADYRIMMHNTSNPVFSLVDVVPDTHFEMPVEVCRDTLSFQIEVEDNSGCISKSNIPSMFFEDITPPPMPSLDSVSIDPFTGELILGWNESPAGDADGYVIYHVKPSINDTLAFVYGATNTSYTDLSFDPCLQNRAYALATYDSCGNISPGSYDIPQRSILLEEVIFDPCTMTNTLNWTEYINMKPNLAGYQIYLSVDGAPFEVLADMPAGTNTYEHTGLVTEQTYRYFIRAYSINHQVTSSSCIRDLSSWQYRQPKENKFENASVDNSELVALSLLPDTFASVPALNIFRSENASGPFELLDEIELQGETTIYYDDLSAEVNSRSYYYYSSLVDSCGNEVLQTALMRTVFLQGETSGSQRNTLNWNAFEGWPSGVDTYEIYRALNEDGSFEIIDEVDGLTLTYEDNISDIPENTNSLRYLVRATDNSPTGLYSQSNQILFEYTPSIFLPNAFKPGGQNPIFKPVGAFINFTEYRMDIYNRWGQLLFSSKDFGSGWDGTYQGQEVPSGPYVCVISYRSTEGSSGNLKTTFILLR